MIVSARESLLDGLARNFARLPGLGPKSSQRLVYHLLQRQPDVARALVDQLQKALATVRNCRVCRNLSEAELCRICADDARDTSKMCVVEHAADLQAIEKTKIFQGIYFVLHGHVSQIDGVMPEHLGLEKLKELVALKNVQELILATNPTTEGEATAHYIRNLFKGSPMAIHRIACGVPVDGEIEFVNPNTLSLALRLKHTMS